MSSRKQYVRRGPSTYLTCVVPRGSVIGPILFVLDTVDLLSVIDNHGLSPHMYAYDTQAYIRFVDVMCTASHSSYDGGCPGTLQTRLRE